MLDAGGVVIPDTVRYVGCDFGAAHFDRALAADLAARGFRAGAGALFVWEAAANLCPLIASCKLHGLDPEAYLRDLFRVLVHWPKDRYLKLAPRYLVATRARLDAQELKLPLVNLTVPEASTKQAAAG